MPGALDALREVDRAAAEASREREDARLDRCRQVVARRWSTTRCRTEIPGALERMLLDVP